ncbi:arginine biosynthesis bifunctional protein ArgJ, chloroplastic [Impatiens glandulifera]|uniref:arginine biosynthesis bifunctional protein ArgJ, chloroplastic n=1 Tax=Impatiens glandulifera TaxID=253017 RepID=UPI001FB19650|nr:arginine biosynthesis bifunctional protein ArgJ, chloroplastic [Impatiens glandulifera]XP_047342426.1 arginine biosynthesis bifunctional protein ArgJ, chloroplastic [Impatiens glandulifera]
MTSLRISQSFISTRSSELHNVTEINKMNSLCVPQSFSIQLPKFLKHKTGRFLGLKEKGLSVFASSTNETVLQNYIPEAPILLPEGPWKQIPGGITAPKGFKAAGMYGGLRAKGNKPDLALVTCDVDAISAGAFTTNVVAAAPVVYCKKVLQSSTKARAVLINAGQANAATGDAGYQDVEESVAALAKLLQLIPQQVLIESTGVIGQRIKKEALLSSLPKLVSLLSSSSMGADSAAVAITTTDLVSKSVAVECEVGGTRVKVGGMAKGSGMIHPNMATMLGVITTDASVTSEIWRNMVHIAVNRSFNQITVDGDTSTNDAVIALASGLSGSDTISSPDSSEAKQLQACLDAVMRGLAKSIASDGEGATCLIEVIVTGAANEVEAAKIARTVASSSLTKAAIYGRDPNWGRIACAAGYAGIPFDPNSLRISLGDIHLMEAGQPLLFDRATASEYLRKAGETHGTVKIHISIGEGPGSGLAWGCDLSYDYVKINAEYTT